MEDRRATLQIPQRDHIDGLWVYFMIYTHILLEAGDHDWKVPNSWMVLVWNALQPLGVVDSVLHRATLGSEQQIR